MNKQTQTEKLKKYLLGTEGKQGFLLVQQL
jgi:hypothetical protein